MGKSYELIICEKPAAAQKIAQALADSTVTKEIYKKKVPYFNIKHNKKEIWVVAAVGHLYNLAEKEKNGWTYPVFDIDWKPSSDINKASAYTKDYLSLIKKVAKDANEFTVACDLDQEGELIGYNILRYACNQKNGNRMEFSTLTKDDLIESYEKKKKHVNNELVLAGETRHILDHYYGINLSRALTLSVKAVGRFKILTTGRVQGPTLSILNEKEEEISKFKSKKYWQIEVEGKVKEGLLIVQHKEDKFWEKKQADQVMINIKGKNGTIKEIKTKENKIKPPVPFDLTSLQIEASSAIYTSPKRTLELAQDLYTGGYISYPRTSSQKLPVAINYKKIIKALSKNYSNECELLLKKNTLTPNERKKTDPAHPAIYPTGETPKRLGEQAKRLYDLICRRFLAVFGDPAIQEITNITVDINKELFITKGVRTVKQGWHELYGKYVRSEQKEIPEMKEGEAFEQKKVDLQEKETQPPKRYGEASLVKELEKRGLGTKATRASIIDNLFQRHYIEDKSIKVTELGTSVVNTLKKYSPDVLSEQLTRKFEEELEQIIDKKTKPKDILDEAKKVLTKELSTINKNEKAIGKELIKANQTTEDRINKIGPCPGCKKGTLSLRRGKFGMFIACDRYKEGCTTTFSIPGGTFVKGTEKACEKCKHPVIQVIKKGKKPQEVCLNIDCPTKGDLQPTGEKCPKCDQELIVRKSIYGSFLCCPGYPKCRYIKREKKD